MFESKISFSLKFQNNLKIKIKDYSIILKKRIKKKNGNKL